MKQLFFMLAIAASPFMVQAQADDEPVDTSWKKIYRESSPKVNDLVHTKLDVRFDYDKAWMYGKEWVTLQPHFYPVDSVVLDAKGMEIKEISLVNGTAKTPLKYSYDGMQVTVRLNRIYKAAEKYTLYIDYISKP